MPRNVLRCRPRRDSVGVRVPHPEWNASGVRRRREGLPVLIITIVSGPEKGRVFRLDDARTHRIGRHRGSIPLDDRSVSSSHAEIAQHNGLWMVTDLDSSNGTWVNKQPVKGEPAPLSDGDRIQFGRTMVVFNVVEADAAGDTSAGSSAVRSAMAVEENNQKLLTEILDLLRAQANEPMALAADHHDDDTTVDLLQKVLAAVQTRRDEPAVHHETAPDLTPKLDAIIELVSQRDDADLSRKLDQLRAAMPAPADAADDQLLGKLDELLARIDKLPQTLPAPVAAAKPADDPRVQHILDAVTKESPDTITPKLDALRQAIEARAAAEPDPRLDELLAAVRAIHIPQAPAAVDLTPVLEALSKLPTRAVETKLDKLLLTTQVDNAAYIAPKLQSILEAVQTSSADAQREKLDAILKAVQWPTAADVNRKLDELLKAPKPVDPAAALSPKLDAVIEAVRAMRDADLHAKLDALAAAPKEDLRPLLESLAQSVAQHSDASLHAKIDALIAEPKADPGPKLEAILEAVHAMRDGELHDKLDALLAEPKDDLKPQLATMLEAINAARDGELHDKLDALANAPKADSSDKLDAILEAVKAEPDTSAAEALAQQVADLKAAVELDRTGAIAAKLEAVFETFQSRSSKALHDRLDAITDALTAPQPPAAPAVDPTITEKLDAIVARLYEPRPASHDAGDTGAKLDVLIDAVQTGREIDADFAEKLDAIVVAVDDQRQQQSARDAQFAGLVEAFLANTDHAATHEALAQIIARLDTLRDSAPAPAPAAPDVTPKLDEILAAVHANAPVAPAPGEPDPRLDKLHALVEQLYEEVATRPPAAPQPVQSEPDPRIDQVLEHLRALPAEAPTIAPDPRLDQIIDKLSALAAASAPVAPSVEPDARIDDILAAVRALPTEAPAAPASEPDHRIDTVLAELTALKATRPVAGETAPLTLPQMPDHAPMLERILEAVQAKSHAAAPMPGAFNTNRVETLLEQLLGRMASLSTVPNPERVVSDMFGLLRSLEQEQQRQADTLRELMADMERQRRRPSAAPKLDDDDEDRTINSLLVYEPPRRGATPAASVVVPHRPQSRGSSGHRSVLLTVMLYLGITLFVVWGVLTLKDGRAFNPFGAEPEHITPAPVSPTGNSITPSPIDTSAPSASAAALSSRTARLP
ncbi:MAG: FHA domain-containing protein [Planctomycetes bacterium]|nr:FHA domain-containing protein [Planctomycetota bacterium]